MTKTQVAEQTAFAMFDRIYGETGKAPRFQDVALELACSNFTFRPLLACWLNKQPENLITTEIEG